MSPSYTEFEDLLKLLYRRRPDKNVFILKALNNAVIKVIIEIAYNIIKGNVRISDKDLDKLKRDKTTIKRLIRKGVSFKAKRKLIEENPRLLRNMLRVIFS